LIPDDDRSDDNKPPREKPEKTIVRPEPTRDKPPAIAKPEPEKGRMRDKSPETIDGDSYDGRTLTRDRDKSRDGEVKLTLGKVIERAADAFRDREKPQEREKSGPENRKGKGGRR
jgi:hypothetical protein